MHDYWGDVFALTWKRFAADVKEIRFLAFVVGAVLLTIYGAYWKSLSDSLSWGVLPFLALVALRALKRGVEQHYKDQEALAVTRGDEIVNLKADIRALEARLQVRADDGAQAAHDQETIRQLQGHQTDGNRLATEIRQNLVLQRHRPAIQTWQTAVENCLQARAPGYLVEFQIILPPYPNRHDLESVKVAWEVTVRINRIQAIVDDLRN